MENDDSGATIGNAIEKCWSTASRAMNNRMISLEPSKIRLMRLSRIARSMGNGFSPRARSESAVSYPRPPRICSASSTLRHASSVLNIFAIAASRRMSVPPRSYNAVDSSATDSIANAFAVSRATFCAIASCLMIGTPHCTRSFAHSRTPRTSALVAPATDAGIVRRPVFSVMSASFSPRPSPHRMLRAGTCTSLNDIHPFSIAFSPMKRQRCSTVMPGVAASTMNAVIRFLRSLPFTTRSGVRAITTNRSARVPFVHQSFSPLIVHVLPSALNVAEVVMFAGSDPAFTSVSAKAVMPPFAMRGKNSFCCSGVPKSLSGCGTPMDCDAERSAESEPQRDVTISIVFTYDICERPRPPYSRGTLMPKAPMSRSSCTYSSGISPVRSTMSAS